MIISTRKVQDKNPPKNMTRTKNQFIKIYKSNLNNEKIHKYNLNKILEYQKNNQVFS